MKRCLLMALGGCLLFAACSSQRAYDYDRIQAEYAATAGQLEPVEASALQPTTQVPTQTQNQTQNPNQKPAQPPLTPGETLPLPRAIDLALINSPDILIAAANIKKAQAMMGLSASGYYPYFGFYTEYLQGDAPSAYLFKTIDQRQLAAGTDFNNPGWFENWESGLTAGINIYNGGRDRLQRELAQGNLNTADLEHRGVKNRLIATVIQAYYDALAARDYIATAEESEATVASQLRIMEVRFASGGALKSDILSLKVRLAEAKENLLRSRNRHRIALTVLANLLGIEPDLAFSLEKGDPQQMALPLSYEQGLSMALVHRPELKAVREKLKNARISMDVAGSNYWPRLDFKTRYYLDDANLDYDADRENWTAGFYLNWDLFTGFSTRHKKSRAKAQMEEMLLVDRKTTLAVKVDVKQAFFNLEESGERLKVARSSVETAKESLKLVKQQYEGGSATITRYLEAELAKSRSMIHATTAHYDHQKALAQVARSIGYWAGSEEEGRIE